MVIYRLPPAFAAARRALAWAAVVVSGIASLGLAWRAILLTVAVALGGCAVLPSQVERPVSYARHDVADTPLAKIAAASTAAAASREVSGFRLLTDGAEAFAARIALIRRAEKTLDVQYYVIADDASGREFLRELQAAAARGVRVRVLVDDLYATGQDALFAGLAAHDHIEVDSSHCGLSVHRDVYTVVGRSLARFAHVDDMPVWADWAQAA